MSATPPALAASIQFQNPLFWAAFIGWVLSVILHEFAHGLVAYRGGDYTIRQRGGLSLNPLQYVDPVMSLILPVIFLLMGGVPLPGGATFVRRDLLRSRGWSSAVSAAGPAMNFLIFLLLALSLNPHLGWVQSDDPIIEVAWTPAQKLVGALAFLQLYSVLLNLIPIPPLDGFGIISPFLAPHVEEKLSRGPTSIGLFVLLFFVITTGKFNDFADRLMTPVAHAVGIHFIDLAHSFNIVFFGHR